jgi:hypothetical protein
MDFFEHFFHLSLEGGNGLAETLFLLGFFALIITAPLPTLRRLLESPFHRLRGTRNVQGESHS